ncbi:MAG: ChbG/HpnK family deacetylase [Candidatus Magasanikbacteria bacterium]|nr:ChbG/HpnK family deacetylase [Candidatus Magasanikbacteria bacterium]
MKIVVSADDYGLTKGVTDTILESVDHGAVTSVSIIANGEDFDRAIEEAKKRPQMDVALHFNLTDGKPLADISQCEIVGPDGKFFLLFQTLWSTYIFSSRKKELQQAIRAEVRAQVQRVKSALPDRKISLNGHDHVHMIPYVFGVIAEVAEEIGISYIRIPEEKYFFDRRHIKNCLGSGLIKLLLLNVLSIRARRLLVGKKVETPDAFVGILFTGAMSLPIVRLAFAQIFRMKVQPKIVEVLFHPGAVTAEEQKRWPVGGRSAEWFISKDRRLESDEVCSPKFKKYIESLRSR